MQDDIPSPCKTVTNSHLRLHFDISMLLLCVFYENSAPDSIGHSVQGKVAAFASKTLHNLLDYFKSKSVVFI